MPPAYGDQALHDQILSLCEPFYPPFLYEIIKQHLQFYFNELYPYTLSLDPKLVGLPLERSDFESFRGMMSANLPDTPESHYTIERIHSCYLTAIRNATVGVSEDGETSPVDRYVRGMLTPNQTELIQSIMSSALNAVRFKIRKDASVQELSIEVLFWERFSRMFANRVRSERIEALVLRYLKEVGYNKDVVEGVDMMNFDFEMRMEELVQENSEDAARTFNRMARHRAAWMHGDQYFSEYGVVETE
ncbi:hypothetical protein BJ508DRAFT_414749 [Ascobolus immersus RN42]|uniref:Uncharacterized protein n=1 Tax=Ascobolus immersus RN42 TaxID=1160509 RepID=A0A3N4I600_ASCIM|nr:hypothetical protein BJ508DRAFT_414749 [Ascobolus immersus RN42]